MTANFNFEPINTAEIATEEREKGKPSKTRSVLSAYPRGVAMELTKERSRLDDILEQIPGLGSFFQEANVGRLGFEPTADEKLQQINQALPIRDEPIERILERGGELTPLVALGGPATFGGIAGSAGRSLLAGGLKEGAKQVGLGETGQSLAELPAFFAPNVLTKKMFPKRSNEELLAFARFNGLTEQEALLATKDAGSFEQQLEKIASRGGKTVKEFENTHSALSRLYTTLKNSPQAQVPLSGESQAKLINEMSEILSKMPAEIRDRIQRDFSDFVGTQMTPENIIDFWQKLNVFIRKGENQFGLLKKPLQEGIETISPELAKDFELTNQLWGTFSKNLQRMRPDLADRIITTGEAGALVGGIVTGDKNLLTKVLGAIGARKFAEQLVARPRWHNLNGKLINAISSGKYEIANKVASLLADSVKSEFPEVAKQLKEFDFTQLEQ